MSGKTILNIVTTQCILEEEEKFNKWYNEVHVPMVLRFKKIKRAARYKIVSDRTGLPEYIALYEFPSLEAFAEFEKGPELAAAMAEMVQTWGKKIDTVSRVQCELLAEWK